MNVNSINYAQSNYSVNCQSSVNFKQRNVMKKLTVPMAAVLIATAPMSCSKDDSTTLTPEERQKADSIKHVIDSLKKDTDRYIDSIKNVINAQKDSIKNNTRNH